MSKQQPETPERLAKERRCVAHDSTKSKSPESNELEFACIPSDQLTEPELESLARLFAQALVRKLRRMRNG